MNVQRAQGLLHGGYVRLDHPRLVGESSLDALVSEGVLVVAYDGIGILEDVSCEYAL